MIVADKKFVVTGAAGFIGAHLVSALTRQGAHVIGIDNERSGDWNRIEEGACEALRHDFATCERAVLEGALDGAEVLFHLAAEKYNSSKSTPQRVIDVNISGTQRLLEVAVEHGVRHVVFTSSLYAYGSLGPHPMAESDQLKPITTYGMSKVAGEDSLRTLRFRTGLSSSVARLFFVYGPGQFAEGGYKSVIVSNFERLRRGEAPVIFGDGCQSLDYVYVADVIKALGLLADPATDGTTVNLSSGKGYTINEVTQRMLEVASANVAPVYSEPDWTHGSARVGDCRLAAQALGWSAETTLEDGLRRVWNDR